MPIGVVSKKYKLIQHYEVFDVAVNAMRGIGIDTELVETKLTITEFGERMALSFLFPEDESYSFSPGFPIYYQKMVRLSRATWEIREMRANMA